MKKVKTTDTAEFGKVRNTGSGPLKFNSEGIAEVENDEAAEALCRVSPSLILIQETDEEKEAREKKEKEAIKAQEKADKEAKKAQEEADKVAKAKKEEADRLAKENASKTSAKVDTVDQKKDTSADTKEVVSEMDKETLDTLVEILSQKGMDELRGICADAKVDASEYAQFKGPQGKGDLVNFIITKKIFTV